ncbi:DEAD/DEAH box helicase [Isosphaeraceae bacterium EP7]
MSNQDVPSGKPAAFSRLHPKVQESLYRMRWTKLRQIQVEAIHEMLDGDGDLVISANTAAGKTEAAFLPILSRIVDDHLGGVRAVYAGPLKALINDQFLRLERLCELAEVPVHKWHGDVGKSARKRLLERPSGILLITPESIESLFINHPHRLATLFPRLEFFVIDEAHSFLGNERGAHLRSLMTRLGEKSGVPVRRIGLSATLGDTAAAMRWLRPNDPARVRLLVDKTRKAIRLKLSGYLRPLKENAGLSPAGPMDESLPVDDPLLADVFEAFRGKSALIFANRKDRIEYYADLAGRTAERRGLPNPFRVHHGSLSKGEREETEDALRAGKSVATFCSSTLEMGIDVGSVKSVGQIGPPWSVGSLSQRLGRSGRGDGESSEIRIYVEDDFPGPDASLLDRIFPDLLQSIAMTELMLAGWCEPPEVDRLHLSTLVQQIMSTIAESGGGRADSLHASLIASGAFPAVDGPTFVRVLRSMGKADLIEQTPEGLLILGIAGERIVRSRDFYMAFTVPEDYRVIDRGRHVGNISPIMDPRIDGYIILAGRRWIVLQVDRDRKEILVERSPGGKAPSFSGGGGQDIHPRVREEMRSLLFRDDVPSYLDPSAREMLERARSSAREAGLDHRAFVEDGPDIVWFTWTGSRIHRTLIGLGCHILGLKIGEDDDVAMTFSKSTEHDIRAAYAGLMHESPDVEQLASKYPGRAIEKYEPFLSDDLQSLVFASHCLDMGGALRLIASLGEPEGSGKGIGQIVGNPSRLRELPAPPG